MTDKKYDLSIIVACYNEGSYLKDNIREIEETLKRTVYSYEIIIIDDCSQNKTGNVIKKICQGKDNYKCYFHQENVGRGGTVKEGLLNSNGKYAGFLDIDLEVGARYISSMIRSLERGTDVATAYRYYDLAQILQLREIFRNFLSYIYRFIVRGYLGLKLSDTETGYKFFNMRTMKGLIKKTRDDAWFWDTEIMALSYYNQKKIEEIPCLFLRRSDKKSTVKLFRDVYQYLVAIRKFKKSYKKGIYD